ncbi:MAG: DM13 domain-containing protein, partial [Pseudomonadales bacterium]|nr:DM13 domain-containing protein [Pseudomonadales bacterium]
SKLVHEGRLAPGPDYKVYLVDGFVEHEDEFLPIKAQALLLGEVKTFDGFIIDLPNDIDLTRYNTVVVWCEAFGEFITSAQYRG